MIRLKMKLLPALKAAGYNSARIRQEKLLGESVLTKLRNDGLPSWHELDTICRLLGNVQPGDIVEYVPDEEMPPEE